MNEMNKILVISDSFKGSLTSSQVAQTATECIRRFYPDCRVEGLPVADGGEGTVECFLEAVGGEKVCVSVTGPWGEKADAAYARIGDTAVVEMAAAAGLPMAGERLDPSRTTTYGVGELIRHAVEHGAKKLILGLGGSATNDGGCGCAAALGVRFYDAEGAAFCPVGGTLHRIGRMDVSAAAELLHGVSVEVMCDIDNPLCGPHGAAAVFGPQKGADKAMVQSLDEGLRHLAKAVSQQFGKSVSDLPGIEVVLDMVDFDRRLNGCSLVITGEGRIDGQSLGGKVPVGVARRAKAKGVPVVAIVGVVGEGVEAVYREGITAVFPTNRQALPFAEVRGRGVENYRRTLEDLLRYTKAVCL